MSDRSSGFSLIEVTIAGTLLLLAIIPMAGVFLSTERSKQQVEAQTLVVTRALDMMEECKATPPDSVSANFHDKGYTVTGVTGNLSGGNVLLITVDSSNTKLLVVTITGGWTTNGDAQSLTMSTEIYNPDG